MKRPAMLLSVPLLLSGCGILGPDAHGLPEEIADHRAVWEATRPQAYSYVVERQCFCGQESRGPVLVRVEGDAVTARSYTDGGGAVTPDFEASFPDVDGLFRVLDDALVRGAASIKVTWADEGGWPLTIYIDYDVRTVDEEVGFAVREPPGVDAAG